MICAALASCGSDRQAGEGGKFAIGAVRQMRAKIAARKGAVQAPAAQPNAEALAASALKTVKGSILIVQIEALGGTSVLGEIGTNGALRTYATPSEQSLVLRDGVLVATRGLGNDLMSADAAGAIALITARKAGTTRRIYRYLDGEGIERPLPLDCTVALAGTKDLAFAGQSWATTQIGESCATGGLTISNAYWVTDTGQIVLSHQWIGQRLGYLSVQLVR